MTSNRGCGNAVCVDIRVFSSCVVPPLGLLGRVPFGRSVARGGDRLWRAFDETLVADWLGFFYIALGRKPSAASPPGDVSRR